MNNTAFTLRKWQSSDLESLLQEANNWKIARNMTDKFPHPYTESHGEAFIEFAGGKGPAQIFAIEVAGRAVGGIGLHPQEDIHRKNAELGYWLGEDYWGKGIISQAILEMLEFAFANPELERVFARPFGSNLASQRVLEKCNFVLEARLEKVLFKNGAYEDELIYALRRENWKKKSTGA